MVHPQWLPTVEARPVYEENGNFFTTSKAIEFIYRNTILLL